MALSRVLTMRERTQLEQRTDAEAKHVAAQLRAAVLKSLDVLPQIASWWLSQGRPESREDWETDAQIFLKAEASLRDLVWLNRSGKAVWCLGPGPVPDFRCRAAEPELVALVPQAEAVQGLTVSRVVLRDGVPSFYALVPVRRGRLIGFIGGGFDTPALIQSKLEEQTPRDYEVRIEENGQAVAMLKQAGALWLGGARTVEVKLANRWWSLQLIPGATDIQTMQRVVWGFGATVAVLLYACTALALIYKRKESALRAEVAERRRAEDTIVILNRDLQHQVTDFRTLLEVLPVGIAVSRDPECRDIWVNPQLAAMLHMSVGENISRSAPDADRMPHKLIRNGTEVPAEELPMQLAARTGKCVLDVELDIVRDDGSVLNTLSYSAPVFDDEGKLRHVINACVDITERKRSEQERKALEERLLRAEKDRSLGLLAGAMAHDFNNLLTAIIGHAELARCEVPAAGPAGTAIREVLSAATAAAELVAQLLAYTGHGWLKLSPLDVSAEVRAISERLRAMAPPEVEISFDLAMDLPPIRAGSKEVQQVLRNLVANAVEAMSGGRGKILVRTQHCSLGADDLARDYPDQELAPGSYVRLEVSDSGGGVPSEVAARVFDPFFTTKFFGRGLGLSAVQGIMRAHGGGVRFDTSSGRGACVQAIFPAKSGADRELGGIVSAANSGASPTRAS
jgi:signal transduction histidine kinase